MRVHMRREVVRQLRLALDRMMFRVGNNRNGDRRTREPQLCREKPSNVKQNRNQLLVVQAHAYNLNVFYYNHFMLSTTSLRQRLNMR